MLPRKLIYYVDYLLYTVLKNHFLNCGIWAHQRFSI